MEQMMSMNRKTGETNEIKQPMFKNRKELRQSFLPKIGDIVNECKVMYVHDGKFQFSAEGSILPPVGTEIDIDGKMYMVDFVNPLKKRYNAIFKGFKNNVIEEAPINEEEMDELVKVI